MFMFRLQKIMDEYAGGISAQFTTNESQLERALSCLGSCGRTAENLAAENLHELMRCWENVHRMWQAEAHVRTMLFRDETRWPGYYFRSDKPKHRRGAVALSSPTASTTRRPIAGRCSSGPIKHIFPQAKEHELLGG